MLCIRFKNKKRRFLGKRAINLYFVQPRFLLLPFMGIAGIMFMNLVNNVNKGGDRVEIHRHCTQG